MQQVFTSEMDRTTEANMRALHVKAEDKRLMDMLQTGYETVTGVVMSVSISSLVSVTTNMAHKGTIVECLDWILDCHR